MRRLFLIGSVAALVLTSSPALPAEELVSCFGEAPDIMGDGGNNILMGTAGPDVIWGGGGSDTIDGLGGDDIICGGKGNDTIEGGTGHDLILGGPGVDTIMGQNGMDALAGLRGGDEIIGGGGRDVLIGNKGNDTLRGRAGGDHLEGGAGAGDFSHGGANRDWCTSETKVSCEGPHGPFRLKANGIGQIPFGTPTDFALVELALMGDPDLEGAPDEDSGWVEAGNSPWGVCPNDEVRMVRWGNVLTFFTRTGLSEGSFFHWQVRGFGGYKDMKLATPQGLRVGDKRGQLELLYNVVSVFLVDPFNFWRFVVADNPTGISGTISNDLIGGEITYMQAGIGCGE